jgi:hypothetical protein
MSKEMRQHIDNFNKFRLSENLNISDVSGSFYGIDDKWIEIYNDIKHLDLSKMDWIDIIVLLGRDFNPPSKR